MCSGLAISSQQSAVSSQQSVIVNFGCWGGFAPCYYWAQTKLSPKISTRITTPPRMRSGGTLFWILDTVPPERILVFSLFFYKDSIPPGRLRAVRYCVKSAGCKVMGANKH